MNSTVIRRAAAPALAWHFVPALLALGYPGYLSVFHDQAAAHRPLAALLAMALCLAVPGSAYLSLTRLAAQAGDDARVPVLRRLAHLTFASPPLYVLIGVLLYLMKIEGRDYAVWLGCWALVLAGTGLSLAMRAGGMSGVGGMAAQAALAAPRRLNTAPVRVLHGISAAAILLVYLFPHLGNHVLGLLGNDAHRHLMLILRHVYRAAWVEPVLISLFFLQIVSGLLLLLPKLEMAQDRFGNLQTATGAYLVTFIGCHINSVFVLARYFGTDTDYAWATGQPTGLVADAWSVRLIPHYSLAAAFVLCHVVCGLRGVLLAHGTARARADRIALLLIGASLCWAVAIVLGMLGVRL
ncbi:hypothetical protein [Burkholderia sp. A1]|uniref:hypothetical protein n=2 Tax=Burkholderia TaxID=32008 RepID=UPI0012697CCC|nr:hypothetical protein [Burkholderia sp. A1]